MPPTKEKILILLLMIILIGCKKEKDQPDLVINSYPMAAGNEWIYGRQVIIEKYDGKTNLNNTDPDTLNFIITLWIAKDTVLNDTMPVTTFKHRVDEDNRESIEYNFLDEDGLKNYAYANAGGNFFPKKHGLFCSMIPGLHNKNKHGRSDEIFYEIPPTLKIKLPLKKDMEWTMKEPSSESQGSFRIDKQVVGMETLEITGRKYECLKVQWDISHPPLSSENEITDWMAKEGLIKRLTLTDTAAITNETGDILYYARLTETLTLKHIAIQ